METITQSSSRYLDGRYLADNPDWHADDAPWKSGHAVAALIRGGIVPATMAEIGCGSGRCLELVHDAFPGSVADGYEISPDAFALCRQRKRDTLQFHNVSPLGGDRHFDLLMALDVVEHVDDSFAFVREMAAISTYQLFHIPLDMSALTVAREWPILNARRNIGHLHYYTRGTAVALLEDCGLEIVTEHYTPWAIDQSYKTLKKRLAAVPRKLAFGIAPHLTVRLVGGWSVMILTRAKGSKTDVMTRPS